LGFFPEQVSSRVGIVEPEGYLMGSVWDRVSLGVSEFSLVVDEMRNLGERRSKEEKGKEKDNG